MEKIIGILLLAAAVFTAYYGFFESGKVYLG